MPSSGAYWVSVPSCTAVAVLRQCGCGGEHVGKGDGSDIGEHHHQRDRQADVTDTVDDKRLDRGGISRMFMVPETNQQIGRKPHTFPTDKHQEVVRAHYQDEHEEYEQIQISEEAVEAFVAAQLDVDTAVVEHIIVRPCGPMRSNESSKLFGSADIAASALLVIRLKAIVGRTVSK